MIHSGYILIWNGHAFLTHDWGTDEDGRNNHERVAKINTESKNMGYKTWFDEDQMLGNIEDQINESHNKGTI